MTPENKPESYVTGLAGTFIGGRISGWVERNRSLLGEEGSSLPELNLLDRLCPSFAEAAKGLSIEEKSKAIREALSIADLNPLSATNYEPAFPSSITLVRKVRQP